MRKRKENPSYYFRHIEFVEEIKWDEDEHKIDYVWKVGFPLFVHEINPDHSFLLKGDLWFFSLTFVFYIFWHVVMFFLPFTSNFQLPPSVEKSVREMLLLMKITNPLENRDFRCSIEVSQCLVVSLNFPILSHSLERIATFPMSLNFHRKKLKEFRISHHQFQLIIDLSKVNIVRENSHWIFFQFSFSSIQFTRFRFLHLLPLHMSKKTREEFFGRKINMFFMHYAKEKKVGKLLHI
jgi:hypothetical protein